MFARQLRSPLDVGYDPKVILLKENYVPQITPYLNNFLSSLSAVREKVEQEQDRRKEYADSSRRVGEEFSVGDHVLLNSHVLSNAAKATTSKFVPKRDGPYVITEKVSPTTYRIAPIQDPGCCLGKFHVKEITRFHSRNDTTPCPIIPKRNRGRPRNFENVTLAHNTENVNLAHNAENVACNLENVNLARNFENTNVENNFVNVDVCGKDDVLPVPVHERGRFHALEGECVAKARTRRIVKPPRAYSP